MSQQISTIEAKLPVLNAEVAALKGDIVTKEAQIAAKQAEIAAATATSGTSTTTVTALEAEIARLRDLRQASNNNAEKQRLQDQIQELNRQLDVAKAQTTDKPALIAGLNGDLTKLQGELAS